MNLLQYNDAKVGDAGPILDVMAVMLENITSIQEVERTTIDVVYRASQIIASMPNLSYQNKGPISLRLNNHQIILFFSSLWVQSISPENMPENYEAIAHTFSMVLLFSRAKVIGSFYDCYI
ncbi:uncharacterized protein LOC107842078 isoform X1 [Capsicum annuum]|uniref:uncharacterized protein LOC107842078 isoform X1 n=1 Tax=Capsicum annuum TaxID=4072 RepID=UPI001FB0808F|nr:uncharacterized protein LOC107842078 isoform X1 [Capsicum annuum]